MPGYISELDYFGTSDQEFVEIAVPAGTDVSSYTLAFYQADGTVYNTVSLGSYTGTFGGQDVYVVNQSTPGFDSGGDPTGTFYPDDAIALVDDSGTVLQFMSWEGNTVNATEGPASGTSSTNAGFGDQSLQSDDGGSSYYAQSSSNEGSIPACYSPGTFIETPLGLRRVEDLREGDQIWTADRGSQTIHFIWEGIDPLEYVEDNNYPVLIQAGALGPQRPFDDLIVSSQHRILVGAAGQLEGCFKSEVFVPAKSLTSLPGIRFMRGKKSMCWFHFACSNHEVVRSNGCLSESLYLGPMVLRTISNRRLHYLRNVYPDASFVSAMNGPLARRCLSVGQVKDHLSKSQRRTKRDRLATNA
ncbi:MAG: Hint domain-containing protein [Pelagimonas sp.]|uniref:Hint domain-containing protein n=1 Tax=Pelagimonas sp. TaxID=2073170 RepID=UPI003D6B7C82